jgi:tetratricopeptide (TPR) repeat protein
VLTCRSDYDDRDLAAAGALRLALDPLPEEAVKQLLDAVLGGDPSLTGLRQVLLERVGGNPLFVEESVLDLVQHGVLVGERGAYRLEHPAATIEIPATVRAVIEARIDRLAAEPKRVLQCAAVLGEEAALSLLAAASGLPEERVRAALQELGAAGLLDEVPALPEPRWLFRHALIHDVSYGTLLHDRRRSLHTRVLAALEARDPGQRAESLPALAHHAFHGEAWEKAVDYGREAGARMLDGLGGREAVQSFEQALRALAHLPDTPTRRALAVDLRDEMYRALLPLGEHARILTVLREAAALAEHLGDDRRLARTLAILSNTLHHVGDLAEAIEAGERAVEIATRSGEADLEALARFSVGIAERARGAYRRAVLAIRRTLALVADSPGRTLGLAGLAAVTARSHLAWSLAELGEFAEAVRLAEEAVELARSGRHAYSLVHAHLGLGGTLLRQGRMAEALAALERGLALSRDAPVLRPPTEADLGVVYALSGRVDLAVALAERAVAGVERFGRHGRQSLIVTHLGEVYVIAGRLADAERQAERALELARRHGERGNEAYADRLTALVLAEREPADADRAREHYQAAMRRAEELGMRPLVARCHLGLSQLAGRLGDAAGARRHLDTAAALLTALQMTFWLERGALDRESSTP